VTNAREVAQLTETLKQKVQAKAQRIRRHEKRETQYSQNKMFKEDTKIFYRNLGMKNIEAREPPSMAEAETYWKSLEEKKHSIMKEQNGQEGKRSGKLVICSGGLYRVRKLLLICQKLTIGNHWK